MTRLSHRLWDDNRDEAARIRAHGFVRGLGDGSLPPDRFRAYVAQDASFLEAFVRAYALCLAAAPSRDDLEAFAGLVAGVIDELRLHANYARTLGIDMASVVPISATRAYVDFLLETARRGVLGETIAAMTPCMRLYAFLGQDLARGSVAPAYADWVRTYADPGFEALAASLEALLDRHATDSAAVRDNYRRAMALEYGFFDANF